MSLANDYRRQFGWRDWPTVFGSLPPLQGRTILDLGCGVGDLAAAFVARGARVIGIDSNEELLHAARSRQLDHAEFINGDLRTLPELGITADGIWSSFTAAYFPDLTSVLKDWARHLRTEGWIVLTEVDDLFGHQPLSPDTKAFFEAYAERALQAGYDVRMGRKLRTHLEMSGFTVTKTLKLNDLELALSGPARSDVLAGWRARFDRLKLLREVCGSDLERVETEFLQCLRRADHRSVATVDCCMAVLKASPLPLS